LAIRTTTYRIIKNIENFKPRLLQWAQQFDDVVWLESNNYEQTYTSYDAILAVDALTSIKTDFFDAFDRLNEYQQSTKDWLFGYLSYDLKNAIEDLRSNNFDGLNFPDLYFFQPKKLFLIKKDKLEIQYLNFVRDELEKDLDDISAMITNSRSENESVKIKMRIHKDEYFDKVDQLLSHIQRGDIYEANFCQEFYAEDTSIDPISCFIKLNEISKPPFATFFKYFDQYLISASPERYLRKEGCNVISQPIKGTSKRSEDVNEDLELKNQLKKDTKERSENIMIVDLVRNDLSRVATKGSVRVAELCKVYSFKQVHQLISTISAEVHPTTNPVDIIKSTFPMGSMTGAPKISAMKIIESLEETKRGLYSGAVGYFKPNGNFDFNVVIRSILYNQSKNYVSYSVGGAITAKSDALKEYAESLIKAKAMRQVLENWCKFSHA
jgi:para-aminobenzoate synthetase component 1